MFFTNYNLENVVKYSNFLLVLSWTYLLENKQKQG